MHSIPAPLVSDEDSHMDDLNADMKISVLGSASFHGKQDLAALLIQRKYRSRLYHGLRLHRQNLIERLEHEFDVSIGAARLLNLILIFFLLIVALSLSDNSATKNGIRNNLDNTFGFENMEAVRDRSSAWEMLREFADKSRKYFPMSTSVYQSDLAVTDIFPQLEAINEPISINSGTGGVALGVSARIFSFTAWVQIPRDNFYGSALVRKPLPGTNGEPSEYSCYEWALGRHGEQHFRYGGHTFFFDGSSFSLEDSSTSQRDLHLPNNESQRLDPSSLTLIAVVVTPETVTFFRGAERLGSVRVKYPMTDCRSTVDLQVGGKGVTLGMLRFYPEALDATNMQEISSFGHRLKDISTGSIPAKLDRASAPTSNAVEATGNDLDVQITLQDARNYQASLAPNPLSDASVDIPTAGFGQLPASGSTLVTDAVTGAEYYSLLANASYLGLESGMEPRYFDRAAVPDWTGQSVTFTMWYQHDPAAPYILAAHPSANPVDSEQCWGFWMWGTGYGFRSKRNNPKSNIYISKKALTKSAQEKLVKGVWRHVAFQLDAGTNHVRVFLDGSLLDETLLEGVDVATMDCVAGLDQPVVAIGHEFPGNRYAVPFYLADLRMYVGLQPLSQMQIFELAFAPSVVPRGCSQVQTLVDDTQWTDLYGHSCSWFAAGVVDFEYLCRAEGVQENCPLTCSKTWCYRNIKAEFFHIWSDIQYIKPKTAKGSICLGSHLDPRAVVDQCREWVATGANPSGIQGTVDSYMDVLSNHRAANKAPFINLTDCDELEAAIDPACGFDSGVVERFTQVADARGGDYTVHFWVRPSGQGSLDEFGNFLPSLTFISAISPAQHNLIVYGYHMGDGSDRQEVEFHSSCAAEGEGRRTISLYQWGPLDTSDWTMMVLVYQNATSKPRIRTGMNAASYSMPGAEQGWVQCRGGNTSSLFSALEVNDELLISPIGLMPWALGEPDQQRMFNERKARMSIRTGPLLPVQEQAGFVYPVNKQTFSEKEVVVASPGIFQTRSRPKEDCGISYSVDYVKRRHADARSNWCTFPNQCTREVLDDPRTFLMCSGDGKQNSMFFGLQEQKFQGKDVFADFLFSLTGNDFLQRSNETLMTKDFIDTNTEDLLVVFVTYSPELGITSVLQVLTKMGGVKDAVVEVKLEYLIILEGERLNTFVFVQVLNLVQTCLLLMDIIRMVRDMVFVFRKTGKYPGGFKVCTFIIDLSMLIFMPLILAFRLSDTMNSVDVVTDSVGELSNIPWGDGEIAPSLKMDMFLQQTEEVLAIMNRQSLWSAWINVTLLLLLMRTVLATNCHPRLALLTGTIGRSLDDLWHTLLLVLLMLCFFASIATWRFGSNREEFSDFSSSMQTQFQIMFGEFQPDWNESIDMIIYTMLFMLLLFLMVLNFLLAIVVEAYMKVREQNELCEVEMAFFTDVYYCYKSVFKRIINKWPGAFEMTAKLQLLSNTNIGYHELQCLKLFDSNEQLLKFMRYYRSFDFLAPKVIQLDPQALSVRQNEQRVAWMLGMNPPNLAQHAKCNGREWRNQHQHEDGQDVMTLLRHLKTESEQYRMDQSQLVNDVRTLLEVFSQNKGMEGNTQIASHTVVGGDKPVDILIDHASLSSSSPIHCIPDTAQKVSLKSSLGASDSQDQPKVRNVSSQHMPNEGGASTRFPGMLGEQSKASRSHSPPACSREDLMSEFSEAVHFISDGTGSYHLARQIPALDMRVESAGLPIKGRGILAAESSASGPSQVTMFENFADRF